MSKVICPKCNKESFDAESINEYSISRVIKSKKGTKICNPCGWKEAFNDMPR